VTRRAFVFVAALAGVLFGLGLGLFSNVSGVVLALYGLGAGIIVALVGLTVRDRPSKS